MCFDKIFPNVSEYFNLNFYIYIKKKKKSLTKLPRSNEVYLQLPSTSKLPLKTPCCTCYITYKGGLYHYKMCYLCKNIIGDELLLNFGAKFQR